MSIVTLPEQPPELLVRAAPPQRRARHGDIILDPPGIAALVGSSSADEEAGQ